MASEHTPPRQPGASLPSIVERKHKPGGIVREYPCSLVHLEPTLAVIEFVMVTGGSIYGTPIEVPPDSVSHGYFWTRQPYNLYRMRTRQGAVIAHRFDAVADVHLTPEAVDYRDLVLDWWVAAEGTLIEEDRDEFELLSAKGILAPGDVARANQAARLIYSRYRHILDDVAALERKLGLAD